MLSLQTGELIHSLKPRMADANRNLTVQALQLVGKLARAMGKAIAREARPILSTSVKNLSDPKTQVRTGPYSAYSAGVFDVCQHVLLEGNGSGHGWAPRACCTAHPEVDLAGHDTALACPVHPYEVRQHGLRSLHALACRCAAP